MVFDDDGRLNMRLGSDAVGYGFMVLEMSGECWVAASNYSTAIQFVAPNR
jgi:hypothetical protein